MRRDAWNSELQMTFDRMLDSPSNSICPMHAWKSNAEFHTGIRVH